MAVRQKQGALIGEMLVDMGLLTPEQNKAVVMQQNQEMLKRVKSDTNLKAAETKYTDGRTSDYAGRFERALKENETQPYHEVMRKAAIPVNLIPAIPSELSLGQLAVKSKLVSKDAVERVSAVQAADRLSVLVDKGLKGYTEVAQIKATPAEHASRALGNLQDGFKSPDTLTRQSQTSVKLAEALQSAIEVGGKDIAQLDAVKKALQAAGKLSTIYKHEAAEQYRADGSSAGKRTANVLAKELRDAPAAKEEKGEDKRSLGQKLVDGVKAAFKAIGRALGNAARWVKELFTGTKELPDAKDRESQKDQYQQQLLQGTKAAMDALHSRHNVDPKASLSSDAHKKAVSWVDRQAERLAKPKDDGKERS